MNFIHSKNLQCRNCTQSFTISEENFPEDLFDLLVKYNLSQLSWVCKSCEKNRAVLLDPSLKFYAGVDRELSCQPAEITAKIQTDQKILDELQKLQVNVQQINNDVACLKNYIKEPDFKRSSFFSEPVSDEVVSPDSTVQINNAVLLSPSKPPISTTPKKKRMGLTVLQHIMKEEIKIDPKESANSVKIVDLFLKNNLIQELKKDDVFNALFVKIYCTGSSYNNLRISEATEYDVNIVLKLPKEMQLQSEFYANATSFAKVKWIKPAEISDNKKHILKFLEKCSIKSLLMPSGINAWFQSLITKFIAGNPTIYDVIEIKAFESGPARTVKLETKYGYSICIDLVPVFEFSYSVLENVPIMGILRNYPVDSGKEFWFVVPKSCKGEQNIKPDELTFSWRVYYPEVERVVLHNKPCAKPVIKLLKLLRDKHSLKFISSYHCKTVVFWKIKENPKAEGWDNSFLYDRFLEALKFLQKCIKEGELPYFFNPEYNLFYKWCKTEDLCKNLSNRLQNFISSIEENPESLSDIFLCKKLCSSPVNN